MSCRWGVRRLLLVCMTGPLFISIVSAGAPPAVAQASADAITPPPSSRSLPLTLAAGVPLKVALEKRVPIKRAGEPVRARLVDTVYIFDRAVLPAGSELEGKVAEVDPVSKGKRATAILNGDFTPLRTARLEFDTVILKDGKRMPLETAVSPGATQEVHLATDSGSAAKKGVASSTIGRVRQQVSETEHSAVQAVTAPGKVERLKAVGLAQLPYHSQAFPKGMRFNAELRSAVDFGHADVPGAEISELGSAVPPGSVVHARLVTPLSSAKDHRGSPVEAVISRPLFSADHHLLLPEGTRLEGSVTQAKPAGRLSRNGALRFMFDRVDLPPGLTAAPGQTRRIEGTLEGAEVDRSSNLHLDAEGGTHAVASPGHIVTPAIAVFLATSSLDLDAGRRLGVGRIDREGANPVGGAVRGGFTFGLVGTIAATAAHSRAVTSGFAFYGAALSVYSHLMARGQDVTFPKHTPMEIRFGTHQEATPSAVTPVRKFSANDSSDSQSRTL